MIRGLMMMALGACLATAADHANWAVPGATYRTELRADGPPDLPAAGWQIRLPDFFAGRPDARDFVLLGADGKEIALETVWCAQGRTSLLLAESMPDGGAPAMLYFGGNTSRRMKSWTANRSLLLETRRLPVGADLTSYAGWQAAWSRAKDVDGAAFVPQIFHGDNPFGESANFISRYSGTLKASKAGEVKFYALSDDVSYVTIDGRMVLGWNKNQPPPLNPEKVPVAKVLLGDQPSSVSYCHGVTTAPGAMVLGWDRSGKLDTVPAEAWVHPGRVKISNIESADGAPVPMAELDAERYLGYADAWYVQIKCSLPSLPVGWQAEWIWPDGYKLSGQVTRRLWMSLDPVRVIVRLHKDGRTLEGRRSLPIPRTMEAASVNQEKQLQPFLELLQVEDPSRLPESARKSGFLLAKDFLPLHDAAGWASAWLNSAKPEGGPWVAAMTAIIRDIAMRDPKAALARVVGLDAAQRAVMGKQADLLELDLRVFDLDDSESAGLAARLSKHSDQSLAQMATIRLGDYHLIHGRIEEAGRCFASVQDKSSGFAGRAPVIDRAHSLAIEALVNSRHLDEAKAKLEAWERLHSAAKIEGDQLFWRARVMMLAGEWKRALLDLETLLKNNPGSPTEIDTHFWQGRALFELNRKQDAKTVWNAILKDFPKHERAEEAKIWLQKP